METKRGASERSFQASVELFARWEAESERTPADRLVAAEFRGRRYLNSAERRWVSTVVYGCIRHLRRLKWLLQRLELPADPLNLVRLWLAVTAAEGEASVLPGTPLTVEATKLAEAVSALPGLDNPRGYLGVTLSFSDDMADSLLELLGEEAIPAAAAFNEQAPTTLRVNPLRVSRDHLHRGLPDAKPTHYSPWGLELPHRVNAPDLPGFRTGWFEVQEEASQLAAMVADAQPGQTVVEIGAGAGGKTLVLAAMMDNRGTLLAVDVHAPRLEELKRRAERAGVTCVQTVRLDADENGWWQPGTSARRTLNKVQARADVVLIDAPCTGSGVVRRSPDLKWREADLQHMLALQQALLLQGAMLTAPNGRLIYVTCAFERDQNEDTIAAFLETQMGRQFEVEGAVDRLMDACSRAAQQAALPLALRSAKSGRVQAESETIEGANDRAAVSDAAHAPPNMAHLAAGLYLRTWPHRDGLDAFFVACLKKAVVGS